MNFRQKDGLKRHQKAKHSERPLDPYECKYCHKTVSSKYSLKVHISRFHEDNNQMKCEACDVTFTSKEHLYTHYNTTDHISVAGSDVDPK